MSSALETVTRIELLISLFTFHFPLWSIIKVKILVKPIHSIIDVAFGTKYILVQIDAKVHYGYIKFNLL